VRALVREYHVLLRSALRARSHLRDCLARCRDCGIFFPTHPRNAGRRDLRCPFGCRQAHGKHCSTQRSVAYYRTKQGRFKKSMHNGKRKRREKPGVPGEGAESTKPDTQAGGYDEAMIEHVRMVTGLFEGRKVSRQEVLKMLEREEKRQQGIHQEKGTDYVARELTEDSS
jgi:hypothetical protein